MAPVASSQQGILSQSSVQVDTILEVKKDDGSWLNLTDRITHDRLVNVSGIGGRAERGLGGFDVTLSSLTLANDDGWWDAPPPAGITSWKRRTVRLSVVTHAGTAILGHWLIEGMKGTGEPANVVLTLVGLSRRLLDREADRCRQGESPYVNRPIGWLVRELLVQEYPRASVEAWSAAGEIANRYKIPLSTPGDRAVSAYGRPPEFDGAVWREANLTPRGSAILAIDGTGTADDGTVYFGLDDELWRWRASDDQWLFIGRVPAAHAGKKIRHLYLNRASGHARVVAVAWQDDTPSATTDAAAHRSGALSGDVQFFWATPGSPPVSGNLTVYAGAPANIFTGHFFVRAGGYGTVAELVTLDTIHVTGIGGGNVQASSGNVGWGANLPIPAGTWTRHARGSALTHGRTDSSALNNRAAASTFFQSIDAKHAALDAGYHGVLWSKELGGDLRPLDYRFSCGQPGGAFAIKNAGDDLYFTVIRWTGSVYAFRLWRLDTWTGSFTDTTVDLGSTTGQPVSMVVRPDDARLTICGVQWLETAWGGSTAPSNEVVGVIHEYAITGTPALSTVLFTSAGAPGLTPYAWLPFEFCYALSSGTYRYGRATFLNADAIGTSKQWVVCPFDRSGGSQFNNWGGYVGGARYSTGRPRGLVYVAGHGKVYWHEAGANVLLSGPDNSVATQPSVLDAGFPPVPDDPSLAVGLVYVAAEDIVVGISGPGEGAQAEPETLGTPLTGKYFLWQYGTFLTDRIACADFSEMNVWEALEELAAVGDFVFGHDPQSGNFYFKPRPAVTAVVGTIHAQAHLNDEIPVRSMEKDWGFDEIFNVAEITPSIAVLKDPEGTARLLARPAELARDTWNGDIFPVALNPRKQTIYLRCVRGSNIGRADDGAVAKTLAGNTLVDYSPGGGQSLHRLRLAWLRYTTIIETQALVALSASDDTIRIPISHAKDLRAPSVAGADAYAQTDVVRVADEIERTIRTITEDAAAGVAIVQLSATLGKAFTVGTRIIIRTRGNNRWSDHPDGVTWLNQAASAVSVGTVETWSVFSTQDLSAGLILRIEPAPGTSGRDVEEVRVKRVLTATTIEVYRGVGGTTAVHGVNDRLKAYLAPIENTTWPKGTLWQVGGSGIALRFEIPASGEQPFMEGDTIDVIAPGLVLEAQENAKQVSYNQASIDRLGGSRISWSPARASRFLGYRQASETSRRVVRDFGPCKFKVRTEGPLAFIPAPWLTWLVIDPQRFPPVGSGSPNGDASPIAPDTNRGIGMAVREFSYNPMTDALTLGLRAVNPHPW